MDRRIIAFVLAGVSLPSCTTRAPTPEAIEAALGARAGLRIERDAYVLRSPWNQADSEAYAGVIDEELARVHAAFGGEPMSGRRIYLVNLADPNPSGDAPWRGAARDGFEGGAFESGFAFVYVRDDVPAAIQAELRRNVLRHELAHLWLRSHRIVGGSWLHEGVARHVEHMTQAPEAVGGLEPAPFPTAWVAARRATRPGDLAQLIDWRLHDETDAARRALRYDQAESAVRFLLEFEPGASLGERVESLSRRGREEWLAREPQWIERLRASDALATIAAGLADPDASRRRRAAASLSILAEAGAEELATPAADELALRAAVEAETFDSAATFLCFFRARELAVERIGTLEASGLARERLLARALRSRRGESISASAVAADFAAMDAVDRARCTVLASLLRFDDRESAGKSLDSTQR